MNATRTASADGPPVQPGALRDWFGAKAAVLDRGEDDTRAGLRKLAALGLLPGKTPETAADSLTGNIRTVEEVSACCLSSGFSLWAQLMVITYFRSSPRSPFAVRRLPGLRSGESIGSTALGPAFKDAAGIERVPVRARREEGGLRLDGPIRWASNLFPGAVVVVPVRLEDDDSGAIVCVTVGDPGVRVHEQPRLLALGATASSSVTLTDVRVPEEAVLSRDLAAFVRAVRPVFLLLQTAFCSGLAGESVREAGRSLTGLNALFRQDAETTGALHRSVRERMNTLAEKPESARMRDLLRLRLDAAHAAEQATRLEATVRGGAGYATDSATNRRLREAAFLPVQSPTEGQLRWELSQSS